MHWLPALDTHLFLFVNRTLANPFFDWLMPILSGNLFFIPLAVLLVLGVFCFGNTRARLCALMIFLVVAVGDPLVINTIKKSIQRPRPFVTLPDARLYGVVGKGYVIPPAAGTGMAPDTSNHNSMPSSHAANWAAMTMVMFLFYRRSLWFMLPLALGVSFSRIYNGMHYPTDVLTGAILGAGYAVAGVTAVQAIWDLVGRRFLPRWHQQRPSILTEPPVLTAESLDAGHVDPRAKSDLEWLRLGYFVLLLMLVGRWIFLASGAIELSEDEAYQWIWSKHLAMSYYSKPLGIALIQFAGTSLFGDTGLGVRFFSPLFATILGFITLRFMAREIGGRPAFWLLLIVTAAPLLNVGTILMTIDPPLVLCWTWAMIAGWRAVQPSGKTRDWLIVGLAMGLGFLCKYTAACQLVCWVVWFALYAPARRHLRKPGPWLGLMIFLVCTLPVVIWNARHGWITVSHVAGDAGMHSKWHFTLRYFTDFFLVELLLLNPIFFIGALWAAVGFWKFRRERPLWLYFFSMGMPLFLGYWLFSFHSRVLPNWPVAAVLPMFCLMVAYWQERPRLAKPFGAVGITLGLAVGILMYQSNLIGKIAGSPLPGVVDPQRRVRGWQPVSDVVEQARVKLEAEGKPAFIIASHYGLTGLLSFYDPAARDAVVHSQPPLVCYIDANEPLTQFYFWPEYDYHAHRKGENAIFVTEPDLDKLEPGWIWKWLKREPVSYVGTPPPPEIPKRMAREFESVVDLGDHEIYVGDRVFRHMHLWACYNLK